MKNNQTNLQQSLLKGKKLYTMLLSSGLLLLVSGWLLSLPGVVQLDEGAIHGPVPSIVTSLELSAFLNGDQKNIAWKQLKSINGSTINISGSNMVTAEVTGTVGFQLNTISPDDEYVTQVILTAPAGWVLTRNTEDASSGTGNHTVSAAGSGTNSITYTITATTGTTFPGVRNGQFWGIDVDVTAPAGASGSNNISYTINGDGFGANPHTQSGTAALIVDPGADPNEICVNVFNDYNSNGTKEGVGELGIAGITVTAYSAANTPTAFTYTSDGNYTFTPGNNDIYRVEVTGLPTDLEPSVAGATTVFFINRGNKVEVGLHRPEEHFPDDEVYVAVPCYVDGPSNGSNANLDVLVVTSPDEFSGGIGNINPTSYYVASHNEIGSTFGVVYSRAAEKIYAAAFTKRHTAFGPGGTGAIYQIGLTSTVAPIAASTPSVFLDLDTYFGANTAGVNTHPNTADFNRDPDTYDAVGKIGLGGLAMSEDENVMWTINLADRRLYEIQLGGTRENPTAPASAASINRWPATGNLTDLPGLIGNANQRDQNIRPFAVTSYRGAIYIGLVATGESSVVVNTNTGVINNLGNQGLMRGYVYKFDPATDVFTQVLDFPLNYIRGQAIDFCSNNAQGEFFPWTPIYDQATMEAAVMGTSGNSNGGDGVAGTPDDLSPERAYPQAWLTDIEFDEQGKIIIGIRDRFADQHGFKKLPPTNLGADPDLLWNADGAGDILVASPNTTDGGATYVLESNSGNGVNGEPFGPTIGINKQEGPGNGEFFYDDRYRPANATADGGGQCPTASADPNDMDPILDPQFELGHDEISLGGLFTYNGTGNVIVSVYDPINDYDNFNQAGYLALSTTDGSRQGAALVYASQDFEGGTVDNINTYGKGNGLGDIEGVASSAPLQVGNRLWLDGNSNGRQDANEDGINGVLVELFKETAPLVFTKVAETTTAADATQGNGFFIFSNNTVGTQTWVNGFTEVQPEMNYEVRISLLAIQAVDGTVAAFTTQNANSDATNNRKTDLNDSDASVLGVIAFTTGLAGENNHTLDMGVTNSAVCSITVDLAEASTCAPLTNEYTLSVTVTYANAPAGEMLTISTSNGGSQSFSLAGALGTETFILTGLDSDGITDIDVTATFATTTTCTDDLIDAYDAPDECVCDISIDQVSASLCDPVTNTYTLSVEVSYDNAPSGEDLRIVTNNGVDQLFTPAGTMGTQTFMITGLTSDGVAGIDVMVEFETTTTCTDDIMDAYDAPADCTPICPSITSLSVSVDPVCLGSDFDATIMHDADLGNLALYYSANSSLTPAQLYDFANHGANGIITLSTPISPAAAATSTTETGLSIAATGGYTIYAILANGNTNIVDPSCFPMTTTTINVSPQANAGTNGNTSVCDNSTTAIDLASLITGEQTGGAWTRLTGSGGTFVAATGMFTPTAGATSSTFQYEITGTSPCPDDQSVATVNISPEANAGTDGNTSVCDNSTTAIDLAGLITGEQTGGAWTRLTGSGGTFVAATGMFTPAAGATSSTFQYEITGTSPCPDDQSVATVNISPQANAGTGSSTIACSGSNTVVDLFSLLTGEQAGGTWTQLTGTGGTFSAAAGTYTITASATTATFRYTITGTSPCPDDTEDVTVNVTSAPTAGTGTSSSICDNSTTAIDLFDLLTGEDSGGAWTQVSGTGGTFSAAGGTFTPAPGATTSVFRYTVGGTGGCPIDTEDVTVNITPQANAGTDGNTSVCDNSTTAIDLASLITGEQTGGAWTRLTGSGGTFVAATGMFTPAAGATSSTFQYEITGTSPCPDDQSIATVNISPEANAGTDGNTSVCDNSTTAIDLAGLITGEQTGGAWTRLTGSGGTFVAATGMFTPAAGATSSTFQYEITGTSPCPDDQSVATVNISPQANAGTGSSTTACAGSNTVVDLFSLLTGEQAGGTWTQLTGTGGTFSAAAGTYTITASATTSTFRYTITGTSPCPDDTEDVTVNVTPAPTAGTGTSTTVCDNSIAAIDLFGLLTGEDSGGAWTQVSGTGGTFSAAGGTFTPAPGATTSVFRYTVGGTGGCPIDTEDVTVNITPQANAGTDGNTSVCDNSTTAIDLASLITGEQTGGAWTRLTGSGGTFVAATGMFTPAAGATSSTFQYEITGTSPCPDDQSVATVNISPQANAGTDGNTSVCDNSTTAIDLASLITGEQTGGAWTRLTGSGGTFVAATGMFTPTAGATSSTFQYEITGTSPCPDDQSVATVNITPQVNAGNDGNTAVCATSTAAIDLASLITGEQTGGAWTRLTGSGGNFVAATGIFTPAAGVTTSTFQYEVTGTSPCPNDQSVATITINPLPNCSITGATTVTANAEDVVYSGTAGMATYAWSVTAGDATIDGVNNTEMVTIDFGTMNTTLSLTITDANGCMSTCTYDIMVSALSLGSTVFEDLNNNGVQDSGENGLVGVQVQLFDSGGTEILAGPDGLLGTADDGPGGMVTGISGNYLFGQLQPGDYYVQIPVGAFAMGTGALEEITISSNSSSGTFAGETDPDDNADNDDEGLQPAGAATVVTSNVISLAVGDEPTDTDTETAQGNDQDNADDSNGNMTLDFGFFAPVTVGDTAFADLNNDGLQTIGEPGVENVMVTIFNNATGMPVDFDAEGNTYTSVMSTDDMGAYLFNNLPPGDYYVVFDLTNIDNADLYDFTTPNVGDDAMDSDAMPVNPADLMAPSSPTGLLASGETDLTLDAGIVCAIQVAVADPFTICATGTVDLLTGASVTPARLGAVWSTTDGTGTFVDANGDPLTEPYELGTAVSYVPSKADAIRGFVTLTLTSNDPGALAPPSSCTAVEASVRIDILNVDCGQFIWNGDD